MRSEFIFALFVAFCSTSALADDPVSNVIKQPELQERLKSASPETENYIKDQPILVLPITGTKLTDTPKPVLEHLGSIDQTKYNDDFFKKNQGSVFALQMKNPTTADFYPIDLEFYSGEKRKYKSVKLDEVVKKNKKVYDQVMALPGMKELADAGKIHGALKEAPVVMTRMSKLGYSTEKKVTIESPWGEQTKPAGQDAWLVWDDANNMYYMVNSGENGLPLSYIPAVIKQDALQAQIQKHHPKTEKYIKDQPILVLPITGTKLADTPKAVLDHLGAIDQTKYNDDYFAKNQGSVFALQMKNATTPDFYPIDLEFYSGEARKYQPVALEEVAKKNKKVYDQVMALPGMKELAAEGKLAGALKTAPVAMIRMSKLGYATAEKITIESPWGEQTKPVGQDAWLVWDDANNMYYMVNSDDKGMPLSYNNQSLAAKLDNPTPANILRVLLGESEIPYVGLLSNPHAEDLRARKTSRVQDDYIEFIVALREKINDRPVTLHEFIGYSDDYANKDIFKSDFRQAVLDAVRDNKKKQGAKAVTIFVLGATTNGLGVGYEIIEDLIKTGEIIKDDIITAGMVSSQAVQHHLDAMKKGEVSISAKQDLILVLNTYKEGDSQTWQLKERQLSESKTVSLLLHPYSKNSVLHVMEGGEQALKEVMELALAVQSNKEFGFNVVPEVRLYLGYQTENAVTMSGFKAATQMLVALKQNPKLATSLKFSLRSPGSPFELKFSEHEAAIREEKYVAAMQKTTNILINQLQLAQTRLKYRNETVEGWLNNYSHPVHNSDDAVDHCFKEIRTNIQSINIFSEWEHALKNPDTGSKDSDVCESKLDP